MKEKIRGYFGVGIENSSKQMNAGNLFRTAHAFGASFLFTINAQYSVKKVKSDNDLEFDYLMCITAYDLGSDKLGLAYNLYSNAKKHSLEIKVEFDQSVEIPSVSSIWKTADWHEREAYDLIGVIFSGHPDMKRILLPHDWEGHPLRKDYKQPDYYRGVPVPKDKTSWE